MIIRFFFYRCLLNIQRFNSTISSSHKKQTWWKAKLSSVYCIEYRLKIKGLKVYVYFVRSLLASSCLKSNNSFCLFKYNNSCLISVTRAQLELQRALHYHITTLSTTPTLLANELDTPGGWVWLFINLFWPVSVF